eukprot:5000980-Ditylum_brightwellii.AAC.1
MTCRHTSSNKLTKQQTNKKTYVATTSSQHNDPIKVDIAPTTSDSDDDDDEDDYSNYKYLTDKEHE